ncbi:MAG: hypothetical protein QNI87_11465 [Erythrobacter sp.]|uniref:hypothetical protein n=1 Tax=Erythrobacter sp. TaxID=1042 RepID=UPI0026170E32|nr:hypothetical protein [Erythrobacter sp.]MDJ0979136.1 hypothetical protein [Erythrobacter sp.]
MVEQIVENREAGRASRSEATLRHGEFGTVALRVEASAGAPISDWRATLSARDPGFVPAVQAALAERSVPAMSESATAQSGFSQRGQDQGSAQSGAWGGGAGAQEQRYGSSPGSGQGGAKPYSGEETDSGANTAAANTRDAAQSQRNETSGGALFA